jgi:DNA-binding NarL/FixJ family response regulator
MTVPTPCRVLVVDDDPMGRSFIAALLAPTAWVLQLAATAHDALDAVETGAPDVVVVDPGLPDMGGVDLIRRLAAGRPGLPVLVLTMVSSERHILEALRAGACGYLFKEDMGRRLVPAIQEALAGGSPLSPAVARLVLAQIRREGAPPVASRPCPELTSREVRVVELLARGLRYGDVAASLAISVNTVRTHVRSIYEKLAVNSRTEAVMAAMDRGLLVRR